MHAKHIFSSLLIAGLISAPLGTVLAANTVATVNGKPISQDTYEKFLSMNSRGGQQQVNREMLINELVNRELLYQAALKQKVDKDAEVKFILDQQRRETIANAGLSKIMQKDPITEADLKKVYDTQVMNGNSQEYKARHILLKTEEDAKAVIAELDSGAVFEDVAKAKSTGPTGPKGGDLGWFSPQQMVPEFSQAASELQKGKYTKAPVKTRFGWHVIKLEDSRKLDPPKYDDVKQQIAKSIQQQRIREYLMELRKKAKIDIKK